MSEGSKPNDAASVPRAKQGVPRASLGVAETYAEGVWAAARLGTAPPLSVARAISGKDDVSASGGRWRAKVTAMRVFHLIEKSEDQMKLSKIGLAIVNKSEPAKQREGRRLAVLSVDAYAKILRQIDGTPLPELGVLAGRFEFDYALSPKDAKSTAAAFIASIKHAEILDGDGTVRLDGEPAPGEVVFEPETGSEKDPPEVVLRVPNPEIADPPAVSEPSQQQVPDGEATAAHQGPGSVAIEVTINMSKWPVDDILKVLDVFGYARRSTSDE